LFVLRFKRLCVRAKLLVTSVVHVTMADNDAPPPLGGGENAAMAARSL
jgi:hypothetical protein